MPRRKEQPEADKRDAELPLKNWSAGPDPSYPWLSRETQLLLGTIASVKSRLPARAKAEHGPRLERIEEIVLQHSRWNGVLLIKDGGLTRVANDVSGDPLRR